jgi:hypothetical protein
LKNPTNDDLKGSIPHLAFEFYHFQFYAHLIQLQIDGRSPIVHEGLGQAVGYTFLMHLRALLDFFYCSTGHDDDLLATDFHILPGFPASANTPPGWVREVKTQLNKRLAHITSPRWKGCSPDMHYYHQHVPEVTLLISSFRDALPSDLQNRLSAKMNVFASRDAALWAMTPGHRRVT